MKLGFQGLTEKIEKMGTEIFETKKLQLELERKQQEEEIEYKRRENQSL